MESKILRSAGVDIKNWQREIFELVPQEKILSGILKSF